MQLRNHWIWDTDKQDHGITPWLLGVVFILLKKVSFLTVTQHWYIQYIPAQDQYPAIIAIRFFIRFIHSHHVKCNETSFYFLVSHLARYIDKHLDQPVWDSIEIVYSSVCFWFVGCFILVPSICVVCTSLACTYLQVPNMKVQVLYQVIEFSFFMYVLKINMNLYLL